MQLSIILINYNSTSYTIDAVDSIIKVIGIKLSFEIFIVDNKSNSDEVIVLKEYLHKKSFNNVFLIESDVNLGFSGGNMLGAEKAKGDYLAFVNNDTLFHEDSFKMLFEFMEQNKSVGVSTCLSKNKEGKDFACFDHFIGSRKLILGRWVLENIFNKPKRKVVYNNPIEVDAVQGCLMFFNRKVFYEVGGFDTNLFLFYEEIDICKRVKQKGYKVVYNPKSYFIHFQGASTKNSFSKKAEILISFLYVLKKNFGKTRFYFLSVFLFIKYFFKTLFNFKNLIFLKIIISKDKFKYSLRNKQ